MDVTLSLFTPSGHAFGQPILLQVQLIKEKSSDEMELVAQAQYLAQLGIGSFDQIMEALKKFNGDADQACESILAAQLI